MKRDFERYLKERYPGQFVYKMISADILGDKETEALLIGKNSTPLTLLSLERDSI
ncbi:hypothetical protein [Alicyclobacillus sp. ALC3]|uniref:hypothetical protein n=1 Tax=Alicyclobacillus sp. ALC3 TaxID=2796143 RepID=UPI002378B412|nr:hypothetical protein [Alicyclobacillus sp. ALC3]WDL99233.1 hypothetical protein JC200_11635 [Alicyclobacillus sp. ALC3]